MLKPRWVSVRPQSLLLGQWLCPACQLRLQWPYRQASSTSQPPKPPVQKPESSTPEAIPSDKEFRDPEFTPRPLTRPIGQSKHPNPGENGAIDHRTWRQRRDDFFDYDKHLERRKELTSKIAKPYFREWTNMGFHRGKTFLAPPNLFKVGVSLYFPNMQGYTLASPSTYSDTTSVLSGKTSIVSVSSGKWAEDQTLTFLGEKQNPELAKLVEELRRDGLQRVWINIEEDWLKAWLVRLFVGSVKKRLKIEDWGRYFVVTKGINDGVKMSIGMTNSKVGHVYLVDGNCRIRWAGNGDAVEGEREGLVAVVKKLIEQMKIVGEGAKMGKVLKSMEPSKGQ